MHSGKWLLAAMLGLGLGPGLGLTGCTAPQSARMAATAPAESGPAASPMARVDLSGEAQIDDLLARMTLERKIAQLIQPDIGSITVEDVATYRFGSVLNGGNSGPGNDDFAAAPKWLELADAMWAATTAPLPGDEPAIPLLWGTDAVHGHANIIGATIFPHNIGLGATNDPDLIRRIGAATAVEIEVTGIDWTFAPTIAVARDDRWGRTYESYSEDPALVSAYGAAMVEGLQGAKDDPEHLRKGHVIATAKHFFGDGGTEQGVDQGDVNGDIDELKAVHVTPYPATIAAGVEGVMASFNSINGRKMHGNADLLTGVLREELGFGGIVVGDWNGHGQVAGCTNTDCPQALLAGLDIYMVPEDWKGLYETLLAQVREGTIPMARVDEAVRRILRVKQKAGFFAGEVKPSARPNGGRWGLLGSDAHRAVAREAVAKSMVVLKNSGVLPLAPGQDILVAGKAADDIAQQSGGWTITWQGGGELTNADFPGATSIFSGIAQAAREAGGSARLSADGGFADAPDIAVVVFGEEPYAEFAGDRKNLAFRDERGMELLRRYKAAGIKTVAVFLSGRPMWVNRELNLADAFVAAWLPGSEGAGVADVLFGTRPASGRLSFSWPASCEGMPLNGPQGALFPFGFGLDLGDETRLPALPEDCAALAVVDGAEWFTSGRLADGVIARADNALLPDLRGSGNGVTARGIDRNAQEDARAIAFAAGSSLTLEAKQGAGAYRITYEVADRPSAPVRLASGNAAFDITQPMAVAAGKGWREMVVTGQCLADLGNALRIESDGDFDIHIAAVVRDEAAAGTNCSF